MFCGAVLAAQTPARQAAPQNPANSTSRPITQQTGAISGTVTKAGTGEPIRKASVTLLPAGQGAQGGRNATDILAQAVQRLAGQRGQQQQPAQGGQTGQPGQNQQNQQGRGQQGQGGGARTVTTADDGTFVFPDVPPGTFRIRVDRDAYLSQEYGQRSWTGNGTPVTVEAGQRLANISFQLIQGGTIAGRILDENLEPVTGIQVQALSYVYQNGARTLVSERQVQTNDLGEYRLYWLTPGDHLVSAIPNSRRGGLVQSALQQRGGPQQISTPGVPEESYAPTFYPGSMEPESAVPVRVAATSEVRGIDFTLRPTPTVRIKGKVLGMSVPAAAQPQQGAQGQRGGRGSGQRGNNNQGGRIEVLLTRIGAAAGGRGQGGRGGGGGGGRAGLAIQFATNVNQDGTFEIANVVPGSYNLIAVQQIQNQLLSTRARLDVGQSDIEGLNLAVRPGVEIQGQFYVDGNLPANFQMSRLRVGLVSQEDLPLGNSNAQVDAAGKFVLQNVPAMTYRVNVQGLPAGAYLIAGRFGSSDALDDALQIDQASPLALQIGFNPGQVAAAVTDNASQPIAGAIAVLVPSVRSRLDLYKTVTTDASGRANFTGVAPGGYKLFAWEDVPQGAYLNQDYLAPFEDRGQLVNVLKDSSVNAQTKIIPKDAR